MRVIERLLQRRRSSLKEYHDSWNGNRPTGPQITIWGALLVCTAVLSLMNYDSFQVGTYADDSNYVILAQSLVRSDSYGLINAPGEPDTAPFPFGYPLLLALFTLVFSDSLHALKVLSLIATLLNATLLFWGWHWFSRRSYWWGLAVAGLFALSPFTIRHSRMAMSEPVFTAFCLGAILLAEQAAQRKPNRWRTLATAFALTFVVFTRTIGLVLVISVFAYLLLVRGRRFWKKIALTVLCMSFLTTLLVWITPVELSHLLPTKYLRESNANFLGPADDAASADQSGNRRLSDQKRDEEKQLDTGGMNPKFLLVNFIWYGAMQHLREDLRSAVLPVSGGLREQSFAEKLGIPFLPSFVGFLISGLVILGFVRWLALEGLTASNLFAILYSGSLVAWSWEGPRLLYPIQPQLHLAFLLGIEGVLVWVSVYQSRKDVRNNPSNQVMAAIIIALVFTFLYGSLTIEDSREHAGDLQARSHWLKTNTASTSIVMTEAAATDYLYSGRKTVKYPHSFSSVSEVENYLWERNVSHILVAPQVKWQDEGYSPSYSVRTSRILPLLEELTAENQLALVYSSEQDLLKVFETLR